MEQDVGRGNVVVEDLALVDTETRRALDQMMNSQTLRTILETDGPAKRTRAKMFGPQYDRGPTRWS
jgi:hypothetical protein